MVCSHVSLLNMHDQKIRIEGAMAAGQIYTVCASVATASLHDQKKGIIINKGAKPISSLSSVC